MFIPCKGYPLLSGLQDLINVRWLATRKNEKAQEKDALFASCNRVFLAAFRLFPSCRLLGKQTPDVDRWPFIFPCLFGMGKGIFGAFKNVGPPGTDAPRGATRPADSWR
jgi:hypothetical protein